MPASRSSFQCLLLIACLFSYTIHAQHSRKVSPKVIAFFTAKNDQAHISFVHEANRFFAAQAAVHHFQYDSTNVWDSLNPRFLKAYQLVIFLDTRPEKPEQRLAFEQYMRGGGAWMGFHFSAFALAGSEFTDNWPWYHQSFLGTGDYKGNTWRPTSAHLRIEQPSSPVTKGLDQLFLSAPNEWYSWERDLRRNDSISILLSIDPSSFPLGTGPKKHEIWHEGYYPVAWSNRYYRMVYFNMGHNDIDYEHGTNKDLSLTFANGNMRKLVMNAVLDLVSRQGL